MPLTFEQERNAAAMLARAFADDPAMTWLFPDPARRRAALPRLFAIMLQSDLAAGTCDAAARGVSLAAWRAPGRTQVGTVEMVRNALPLMRVFGGALPRALALEARIQAHHPPGAFWYLHILGTDPPVQGAGHGGGLVRAGTARADAAGLSCVLETATAANLPFYRALGFAVIAEWRVTDGPQFWTMLRAPT